MKLSANGIEKSYKGRKVVKGISLELNQGEIVGLLGPNGAGKTTSFYMIVGLIKPNDGSIYLDNQEITKFPMYQRAQRGIGYLAQEASVFRKLSVENNILRVLQMTKLPKDLQKEKMESLLEEFGLNHIRKIVEICFLEVNEEEQKLQEHLLLTQNSYYLMNHLQE